MLQGETGADDGMEADDDAGQGGDSRKAAIALELLPFPQVNVVDFGSVHINERAARKVTIPLSPVETETKRGKYQKLS